MFRDKYIKFDSDIELLARDKRITSIERSGHTLKIDTTDLLCEGVRGYLMTGELSIEIDLSEFGQPRRRGEHWYYFQPVRIKNKTYKLDGSIEHPMVSTPESGISQICWSHTGEYIQSAKCKNDLLGYVEILLRYLTQSVGYYDDYYPQAAYDAAKRYKADKRGTAKSGEVARVPIPFFKKIRGGSQKEEA